VDDSMVPPTPQMRVPATRVSRKGINAASAADQCFCLLSFTDTRKTDGRR